MTPRGLLEPHPIWQPYYRFNMITNVWINRISVLVVLAMVYAVGYAGGREQAGLKFQQHPAAHLLLKP